jgi:hypothetical protein
LPFLQAGACSFFCEDILVQRFFHFYPQGGWNVSRLQKSLIVISVIAITSLFGQDSFTPTGSLLVSQAWPGNGGCINLNNGKVLVIGGSDSRTVFAECELYDPATGTWSLTGSLLTARCGFGTVQLADGRVLVMGGIEGSGNVLATSEIYDPLTGTWSQAAPLSGPRFLHVAVRLNSGKVLVAAGRGPNCTEIYDPTTDSWSIAGAPNVSRTAQYTDAVLLSNGDVLMGGGATTNKCELFDPLTGTWTLTGAMTSVLRNQNFNFVKLPSGKVLAAGGQQMYSALVTSEAELYDPATGVWTPVAPIPYPLCAYSATLLKDGNVLFAGGVIDATTRTDAAAIFNASNQTWSVLPAKLGTARNGQLSTCLQNGNVLIVGGLDQTST